MILISVSNSKYSIGYIGFHDHRTYQYRILVCREGLDIFVPEQFYDLSPVVPLFLGSGPLPAVVLLRPEVVLLVLLEAGVYIRPNSHNMVRGKFNSKNRKKFRLTKQVEKGKRKK